MRYTGTQEQEEPSGRDRRFITRSGTPDWIVYCCGLLRQYCPTCHRGVHPHAHAIRLAFEEAERAKTRSGYDAGVFQMHVAGKKLTFAGTEQERKHQKEWLCRSNSGPPSVRCVVPRHKSSVLDLGALIAHPPISEKEFLTMYILSSLRS